MGLLQPLLPPMWHWVCWSDSKLGPRAPLGSTKKERPQAPLQLRNWIDPQWVLSFHWSPFPPPSPTPSHRASKFLCIWEVLLTSSRIPNSNFRVWSIQHLQRKACFEISEGERLIKSESRANSIMFQKRIFSGERGMHASQRGAPYISTRTAMGRTRCVGSVTVPSITSLAHWQFKPPWLPPDWVPAMFLAQERTQSAASPAPRML